MTLLRHLVSPSTQLHTRRLDVVAGEGVGVDDRDRRRVDHAFDQVVMTPEYAAAVLVGVATTSP